MQSRRINIATTGCILILTFSGCANQTTPTGGPRDEKPPLLISSVPAQNQKNFKGKKLQLTFSEDVQLREPKEQILITPTIGKEIIYSAKKNSILIEPENDWKDSTTYSIQFRESVRDLTEGNPALNLKLAFSTGSTIDSLSLSGNVHFALSEKIPEDITVAIYKEDTFDIFKHTPSYFTKINKLGKFRIENLKQGNYYIYAFDDKNKNLKVESTTEKYAFLEKPVFLSTNRDSLALNLINLDTRPIKLNSVRSNAKTTTIRFNKLLSAYTATFQKPQPTTHFFGTNTSEITFYQYVELNAMDSIPVQLHVTDSLNQSLDSVVYLKTSDNKYVPEKFALSIAPPEIDLETSTLSISGKSNKPIRKFILDSLIVKLDTGRTLSISTEDIQNDTINKIFKIYKTLDLKNLKPPVEEIKFKYGKGFIISMEGDSSKTSNATLSIYKPENLGTLSVEIKTTHKDFVVELLSSENKVIRSFKNKSKHLFLNLAPQEYKIRCYADNNQNGQWDPGNFYTHTEPEPTYFYQTPEKKFTFPIRANWELGPLVLTF